MESPDRRLAVKGERTLITALLFSAPGPLITLFAAITSRSATQIADFVRRTAELIASFVSWLVYRKLGKKDARQEDERIRLERVADRTVALAMLCSGIALCAVGILRLSAEGESGRSIVGLVTAALGLIANTIFFFRYGRLAKAQGSSVLAAQHRLYQAKACVDLCVTIALAAGVIAPVHPATRYIDAFGSILVAVYLLYNGVMMFKPARRARKA